MLKIKEVGEFLRSLRIARGLTQTELADILNVSNKTVSKWESGVGLPELTTMMALADFYEVSVDDILRGTKKASASIKDSEVLIDHYYNKTKNRYINLNILSFGIWSLGLLMTIVIGEATVNSLLGMAIGLIFIFLGVSVQIFNLIYTKQKTGDFNIDTKNKLYNVVFKSTFIFGYLTLVSIVFALQYNLGYKVVYADFNHTIRLFILSFGYVAIFAIGIYYIIRLFKPPYLKKLKIANLVFNSLLFVLLVSFTLIASFGNLRKIGTYTGHAVTYTKTVNRSDEDNYYKTKFALLYKAGEARYQRVEETVVDGKDYYWEFEDDNYYFEFSKEEMEKQINNMPFYDFVEVTEDYIIFSEYKLIGYNSYGAYESILLKMLLIPLIILGLSYGIYLGIDLNIKKRKIKEKN